MDLLLRQALGWIGRHFPFWVHVPRRTGMDLTVEKKTRAATGSRTPGVVILAAFG